MYRNSITIALFLFANYLMAQNSGIELINYRNINLSNNFNENNRGRNINLINISNQKVNNPRNIQLVQNDNATIQARQNFSQKALTNLIQQSIPKQNNTNKIIPNTRIENQTVSRINIQVQQNTNINRVQQARNSNPVQITNDNNEINAPEIEIRQISIQMPQINIDVQLNEINLELNKLELPKVEISAFTASFNLNIDLSLKKPDISLPELVMPEINISKINLPVREKNETTNRKTGNSHYTQQNKNYTAKKIKIWFRKNFKIVNKIRFSVSCPKF